MNKNVFPIVIALIRNEKGEILLAQRDEPKNRDAHGKWEFLGGGIEIDEKPEDAIVRECREEAGIDVAVVRLLPKILTHTFKHEDGGSDQIIMIPYECKIAGGDLKPNLAENVGELTYIHPKDLDNYDFLPNTKEAIALLDQ